MRLDSEFENGSLNQKVNNILLRWLFSYRAIGLNGAIVVPGKTWLDIIEALGEDFLVDAIDHGTSVIAATLTQNDIELTVDNIIKFVFGRISIYSGSILHFHHYRNSSDNLCLVFEHPFGIKWSRALGKSFCRLFNEQFGLRTDLVTSVRNIHIVVHTKDLFA